MLWYLRLLGHLIWLVFCRNIYKHNKDTLDWANHDCDIFNTNSKVRRRERKTFSPVKSIKRIGIYCTWINNNVNTYVTSLRWGFGNTLNSKFWEFFKELKDTWTMVSFLQFLKNVVSNCNCVLDLFNSWVLDFIRSLHLSGILKTRNINGQCAADIICVQDQLWNWRGIYLLL